MLPFSLPPENRCWQANYMDNNKLQTFDPTQSWSITGRKLPHWEQAGTVCFITWRTRDSMPADVVKRWVAERDALLRSAGLEPVSRNRPASDKSGLRAQLVKLPPAVRYKLQWMLTECFEQYLDRGHGACALRQRALQEIVRDSLLKFDGDRYELTDFVIMPNHIHLLAAFPEEGAMRKQCSNRKRYTAREINKALGRRDEFWQEDEFDHLVRTLEYFDRYRDYIAENGSKANLPQSDYLWFRKP